MGKITDINVKIADVNFSCRACAVVINEDKVLFQKKKGDRYWALPGGKIGVNEKTSDTVRIELEEELNITDFEVQNLISVTENFFKWNGEPIHQYIFTHKVKFIDTKYNNIEEEFDGVEVGKNVIYKWIKISDLSTSLIKPDYVVNQLLNMDDTIKFETCIED
ncbi:MAG: NUDIX domain-containing protein [Bacilli bacterium]|nr:NUDIX domain-containing protein [Bacilli bacterium]MDD4734112.1 NUDIX domain-containing protein [Bacilli bacterium]